MFGAREPRFIPPDADAAGVALARRSEVDPARLRRLIESLPAPRSRLHHPADMARADVIVCEALRSAGWDAALQPFHREQAPGFFDLGTWDAGRWGPTVYPSLNGVNVVALREGEASRDAVVVLAHHDTVRDSPGADDNTAGVAALIEVARLLGDTRFAKCVVLAAVDMEEVGLHGSDHLAAVLAAERRISAVVVFETLAYSSGEPGSQLLPPGLGLLYRGQAARMRQRDMAGDFVALLHRGDSRGIAASLAGALELLGRRAITLRDPGNLAVVGRLLRRALPLVRDFARSDHKPFWDRGIPAVLVTDTANFRYPHYHQPTDTVEKLDLRQLADISAAVATTVDHLAGVVGRR